MVNEFVPASPKRDDDKDCFCQDSSEKPLVSDSSDEDTTSSSLMPIPDTLDVIRSELKSTINNFGATDYASAKPNDFTLKNLDLDTKHPTEREVSIVQKITSANLLLDDLLDTSNILPKNVKEKNPLVFNAKTVRQRSSLPGSESSGPSTGSTTSSSDKHFISVPMASFPYPPVVCGCSRFPVPTEKPEPASEPVENDSNVVAEIRKAQKRSFLLEQMRYLKLIFNKRKGKTYVSESQQTQGNHPNGTSCPWVQQQYPLGMGAYFMDHPRRKEKLTCSSDTCHAVHPNTHDGSTRRTTRDVQCGSDDALECPKNPDDSNVADQEDRTGTPLIPFQVGPRRPKERIDIYYFDHGNSSYYRTTDSHRARFTEYILERTDEYATKFWAEVFGTVTIAVAFVVSFILQLYRCVFTSIIRALTVGLIQIFSDYFFKPLLTVLFNGLIQPCLILGYNIATSTKDFCIPVCEICEFCAKDLAIVFGSCRLVEVKQRDSSPSCHCRHNI